MLLFNVYSHCWDSVLRVTWFMCSVRRMIRLILSEALIHSPRPFNLLPRAPMSNFNQFTSQPVHDELEYIKMRYRSPARSSFRDQKAYETLNTRSTYTNSTERNPDFSDNSTEHLAPGKNPNNRLRHSHCNATPTDSPRLSQTVQTQPPPRFTNTDYIDRSFSNPYPAPPAQTTLHGDLGDPFYRVQNIAGSTVI
eukprot:GHVO01008990.1.p1 GENE.GHVO01008990.1~~GHVO01008990.1.p1  ORF type:complete len:195 (-),score=4.38 GHVO01008990.1:369-953(-)